MAYRGNNDEGGCLALFFGIIILISIVRCIPSIFEATTSNINESNGGAWLFGIVFVIVICILLFKDSNKISNKDNSNQINKRETNPEYHNDRTNAGSNDTHTSIIHKIKTNVPDQKYYDTPNDPYKDFCKSYHQYYLKNHKLLSFYNRHIVEHETIITELFLTSAFISLVYLILYFSYSPKIGFDHPYWGLLNKEIIIPLSILIFSITIILLIELGNKKLKNLSKFTGQ